MSINRGMDKDVAPIYNGILLSQRKEGNKGNTAQPIGGEGKEKAGKTKSNKNFQFLSVFRPKFLNQDPS